MSAQRTEWPELVGMNAELAKQTILSQNPDLNVEIIPSGSMVTMDWREDRVRIYYNETNNVVDSVPTIG